jgi:acyl carrier protein
MDESQAVAEIKAVVARILQDKGEPVPPLVAETELLGGAVAIDSLDLAVMVSELEGIMGKDPFSQGFVDFRTIGELAQLYTK